MNAVINHYSYTSLGELNAILKQYNIIADRGKVKSNIYEKRGLYYRMLDENGHKIGVSLKASTLPGKPTLSCLEQRFESNKTNKELFKQRFEQALDYALAGTPKSMLELEERLNEKSIALIVTSNNKSNTHEITFIDKENKCAFSATETKEECNLKALIIQLKAGATDKKLITETTSPDRITNDSKAMHQQRNKLKEKPGNSDSFFLQLIKPGFATENTSAPRLYKTKKVKRNKRNHNRKIYHYVYWRK